MYSIEQISKIISTLNVTKSNTVIEHLLIDSRKISFPKSSLFFAIVGDRRDGHNFIDDVYKQGVRHFVISKNVDTTQYNDASFLLVDDTLKALQTLASQHRSIFNIPIIGITGSNGKTIVKEWLNQLLHFDFSICRSPKSYNSQIGVPLSVWQLNQQHNLGIFEAGISTINEMQHLEKIIKPTIGIFTNIGVAHAEGFENIEQKIEEKLKLFIHCKDLIYCCDDEIVDSIIKLHYEIGFLPNEVILSNSEKIASTQKMTNKLFSWGKNDTATLQIIETKTEIASCLAMTKATVIKAKYQSQLIEITIPFTDEASIQNACTCWSTMLFLEIENSIIQQQMLQLHPVEMRLQLVKAANNCILINDSYSNDLSSFKIALDYLSSNAGKHHKSLIISDFGGSENNDIVYYQAIESIIQHKINKVFFIGNEFSKFAETITNKGIQVFSFNDTQTFLNNTTTHLFKDEYILLKGARVFNFELISKMLQQKTHQTVMEINLTALVHNLKEYQKHLLPTTKTMAMVKAFSYGSGSAEIAKILEFHKIDYLGVAYADEGIDLRKAGIHLPIMVLNVDEENFDALLEYNLEPEIFSFSIYNSFNQYLLEQGITNFPVHIKLNTGMNRLGFEVNEVAQLAQQISTSNSMYVKSVLSHLASSEDANDDDFTQQQLTKFDFACQQLESTLNYTFIKHIANSAAIFRHHNSQYDLVRLGIGLYGVDSAVKNQLQLQTVATLKTTIAQIRSVKANDSVGYNRKGKLTKDSKIATVRIGYADGLNRTLSNGKGFMYLHNKLAPVIGNVCMDMTMIDVTEIPEAQENDVVEIFGKNISVTDIAKWSNTIAYETLSCVNQRVRRIYIEE